MSSVSEDKAEISDCDAAPCSNHSSLVNPVNDPLSMEEAGRSKGVGDVLDHRECDIEEKDVSMENEDKEKARMSEEDAPVIVEYEEETGESEDDTSTETDYDGEASDSEDDTSTEADYDGEASDSEEDTSTETDYDEEASESEEDISTETDYDAEASELEEDVSMETDYDGKTSESEEDTSMETDCDAEASELEEDALAEAEHEDENRDPEEDALVEAEHEEEASELEAALVEPEREEEARKLVIYGPEEGRRRAQAFLSEKGSNLKSFQTWIDEFLRKGRGTKTLPQKPCFPVWEKPYYSPFVSERQFLAFVRRDRKERLRNSVHVGLQCELEKEYMCTCAEERKRKLSLGCYVRIAEEQKPERPVRLCSTIRSEHGEGFFLQKVFLPALGSSHPPAEVILRLGWCPAKVDKATQCNRSCEEEETEPQATTGPEDEASCKEEVGGENRWESLNATPKVFCKRKFFFQTKYPYSAFNSICGSVLKMVKRDKEIQCNMNLLETHPDVCEVCGGRRDWKLGWAGCNRR